MKKLLTALFMLFPLFLFSQGTVELEVNVLKSGGARLPYASVKLVEKGGAVVSAKANGNGSVKFTLSQGRIWNLYVNDLDMHKAIEVPAEGKTMFRTTVTYNPKFQKRLDKQTVKRSNLNVIPQKFGHIKRPVEGRSLLRIKVQSRKGRKYTNVKVRIVEQGGNLAYSAMTNPAGIAQFQVKPGTAWDVDVEDVLNITYADIRRASMIITVRAFYEKPNIREIRSGDTLIQDILKKEPVSGRALYTIRVEDQRKNFLPGEWIYLRKIHGNDIYKAQTDKTGKATFMLPIGFKYMVNFDYQLDVDVVNLKFARGFVQGHIELTYFPNPRLEHPERFIPGKEELFVTEFTHFLNKQYPSPLKGKSIGIDLHWGNTIRKGDKDALLEIGYSGGKLGKRIPLNLAFVLDNSGSMAGYYRIEKLKAGLKKYISMLKEGDRISIITYESNLKVVSQPILIGLHKADLYAKIDSIEAGGGTDMLEALKLGYSFVEQHYDKKRINSVIVLSDGHDANKADVLLAVGKKYNKGITCSTIGVGESYNVALLTLLVQASKGRHFHIKESEEFEKLFIESLRGFESPVASDVTLEVEYHSPLRFKHLYGLKPIDMQRRIARFHVPHLYSGDNQIALVKFGLTNPSASLKDSEVTIRFKYTDPHSGQKKVEEKKIKPVWEEATGYHEIASEAHTKKLYAIAEMNRSLKLMAEYFSAGKNQEAHDVLMQCRKEMLKLYPQAEDEDVKSLMHKMSDFLSAFKQLQRNGK